MTTAELAVELVDGGRRMAAAECRWLEQLAEFDRREGWFLDGQLSGAEWLSWRCGVSRITAREKLRVAHHWKQLRDQERGVDEYLRRYERRTLRASRTYDGMGLTKVVLPAEEHDELQVLLAIGMGQPVEGVSAESTGRSKVDALMDLLRAGAAAHKARDVDRCTLHVVGDLDALIDRVPGARAELIDGTLVGSTPP